MQAQENLPFVNFNAYRFNFRNIRYRTKNYYDHPEIAALKLVCEGQAELCKSGHLEKLEEYGLIRREGESWKPTILVFRQDEVSARFKRFSKEEQELIHGKARRIEALMREQHEFSGRAVEEELPELFRRDERPRSMIVDQAVNDRGYVLEEAFRTGWLRDDETTSRVIGAWITL